MPPDTLLLVGRVISLMPDDPGHTALGITDGRISWLGSTAEALALGLPPERVLHRPHAVVVPGLIDSHAHLTNLGRGLTRLDLTDTPSLDAVVAKVASAPGEGWIIGRGWDQNDWQIKAPEAEKGRESGSLPRSDAFPDRAALDAVTRRPVALTRIDGHVLFVNSPALAAAGIDATTPDPPGGRILRRPDGSPTGVLIDAAMDRVQAVLPPPTREETRQAILAATAACHRAGLTEVHDAGTGALELSVLEELDAQGQLPLRVYAMLWADDPALATRLEQGPSAGHMLTVRAVKLFGDGALGSRGAWLKAPYSDAPDTRGIPVTHGQALKDAVKRFAGKGFQVGVHAIGDAAATDALDAFEAVLTPGNDRRFRLEHAQIVAPADQERMARLGIIAMVQPTHATSDMPWAEARLGPERIRHAYAWQSLRRAGVRLALGSDFPVERPAAIEGLHAAITRTDGAHQPPGGWYPDEALTARQALEGFTTDAAFAAFAEARRGRIALGMDADLTLLSADPLATPAEKIKEIKVLGVVVAGRPYEVAP